jgi:hypothetical protein
MRTGYSVNRIEIVIKVSIEFAAALRAFAAKLLQRRLEPSLLDSQRTKSPLVDVQRQFVPSLLYLTDGPGEWIGELVCEALNKKCNPNETKKPPDPFFSRAPELV